MKSRSITKKKLLEALPELNFPKFVYSFFGNLFKPWMAIYKKKKKKKVLPGTSPLITSTFPNQRHIYEKHEADIQYYSFYQSGWSFYFWYSPRPPFQKQSLKAVGWSCWRTVKRISRLRETIRVNIPTPWPSVGGVINRGQDWHFAHWQLLRGEDACVKLTCRTNQRCHWDWWKVVEHSGTLCASF